jgi:hypothetical protein
MDVIKSVIGCALIILGLGLAGYYFFGPADKQILARQADGDYFAGSAKNLLYLVGGIVCCGAGAKLLKRN